MTHWYGWIILGYVLWVVAREGVTIAPALWARITTGRAGPSDVEPLWFVGYVAVAVYVAVVLSMEAS